ncbi:MAG TPA: tetratricopeptide repeat protein [Vicinamibacterales bacterium]|nr:tetratricopeptide repeat protein [Vicinamibacterales bacterium]
MARQRAWLFVACVAISTGVAFAGQGPASPRVLSRIDRLDAWLSAVEQHRSGTVDGWALGVRDWDAAALDLLRADLGTIVSMIREPKRVVYDGAELARLKAIAQDVVSRGGENRILRRGAMLHADIAMFAPFKNIPSRKPAGGPIRIVNDGQQTDVDRHFEFGRTLLDSVQVQAARGARAGPGADETVRLWYLAIGSYLQAFGEMDFRHVERSLQLFPRDAEVLFFAACLQEMASSPQAQSALQAIGPSKGTTSSVRGEGAALREAERLFRQALDRDPLHVETRLRLGRVLGRRGRHEEAARELRQARAATESMLLQYYANMFMGAELEALGRTTEAREAYELAADTYQKAQAPRLALNAMAASAGDRTEALRVIESALRPASIEPDDDPWWDYYTAQARATDVLLGQLRARIAQDGSK